MDEIPEPGCFKLWETAGQPVVILHTRTGEVRAYYNTCRHRGAPLVREATGKADRFTCGYHGWTYNHDGELINLRDKRDFVDLDFSCRDDPRQRPERLSRRQVTSPSQLRAAQSAQGRSRKTYLS